MTTAWSITAVSNAVAAAPVPAPKCTVYAFTEESCFDKAEQFRAYRCPVVFRLFSVGKSMGDKIDVTFVDDYGVYYGDDTQLITALSSAVPHVNWARGWVYHRWLDHSRILILNAETGKTVAQIETRRYEGRSISPAAIESGAHGANVAALSTARAVRAAQAEVQA